MRIDNIEDARGVVRRYIVGTRSRHRKIISIVIDEEPAAPDEKGVWTIKGTYATEESGKEQFNAQVTSHGEVLMTIIPPQDAKKKLR